MSSHVLVRGCKWYFYTLYHLNVYINSTGKRKSQGRKSRERVKWPTLLWSLFKLNNYWSMGNWHQFDWVNPSGTSQVLLVSFCHRSMSFDVLNSQCPLWFAHYKVPPAISLLVDFFIPRTAFSNPSICPDHQTSQGLHFLISFYLWLLCSLSRHF